MESGDMSLNSIVKDLVNEYVKPKYPLYRAYYIVVYCPDGCEVHKKRRSKIVEIMCEDNIDGCFEKNKLSDYYLDLYNKDGVVQIEATEEDENLFTDWELSDLEYIVYKMERLA